MSDQADLLPVRAEGETLVPGYRVVAHLSRNRALDVYDVWSEERHCRCVAKVLRPDKQRSRDHRRRLLREGRLLEEFAHPHIVRAYAVRRRPDPVVILETLSGETLARLIHRRSRRLSLREVGHLGLHLCSALHYLHRRGVLHLDVKPSNVIANECRAILIDLSLARSPGWSRKARGTRCYMAPEQFGGAALSRATDVWGLGALLYEAATAVGAFRMGGDGGTGGERRAPSVATLRRLPDDFAAVVDSCLDPDPRRRPSLEEVADTLRGVVSAAPSEGRARGRGRAAA